ncbi:hypothetical protein [Pseudarthrobacter sp. NamE5]|uniref:hypothetical protein n=1 Tax=Pseudarthrobacter sp. NamE5 TaxID=2576839 RepID=UPI00110B81FF|nr:hypothetical protein [Pseudarthrobacter sp. NamE5]TLM83452.1 hypothetical protein FDW84_13540 [Pseudarthrobacter sp. NamE5]
MSPGKKGGARRPVQLLLSLLLVGILAAALVTVPGLLGGVRSVVVALGGASECVVETAEGEVGLNREKAKLATTAVALAARGAVAPDTSDIDPAVLQRLADGPPGDAGPSLSCRGSAADDLQEEQLAASGLTPRAERLRGAMTAVFSEGSLGGFAPGGVSQGHGGDSTHYDGRAIDIFFRPVSEENRREGWVLAHWLVAHAEDLDVQYVIFDDQFWSVHSPRGRWHDYNAPDPGNEILRHLDHVHVDVLRGSPS